MADIVLTRDFFTALAPALEEGQRIVNGMQDILKLFLARISTVRLIIVSSLVLGTFPLLVRQGSVVTLFAVGIPAVLLAFWAQPGPTSQRELLRQLIHFVLTPVLGTSAIGLLPFYGALYLELTRVIPPGSDVAQVLGIAVYGRALPVAQTVLAAFLVACGLFLVVFVQPPTPWWTSGNRLSGDWRPTLLAGGLMVAFVVLDGVPSLGGLFALAPLGPGQWGLVVATTLVWLFFVRWMWRADLLVRFVGVAPLDDTRKSIGG